MTSGVSVGSSSSATRRLLIDGDGEDDGRGCGHRDAQDEPFRHEVSVDQRERGRSSGHGEDCGGGDQEGQRDKGRTTSGLLADGPAVLRAEPPRWERDARTAWVTVSGMEPAVSSMGTKPGWAGVAPAGAVASVEGAAAGSAASASAPARGRGGAGRRRLGLRTRRGRRRWCGRRVGVGVGVGVGGRWWFAVACHGDRPHRTAGAERGVGAAVGDSRSGGR